MALEKDRLKLGFVPLVDAAPLVVAKERGFFAEQGLTVELSREPSWANIRDKVAVGALDAAHMLATMPLSMSLGLAALRLPVIAPMALNLGGNAITVSSGLARRMALVMPGRPDWADALHAVIRQRAVAGERPLTFAVVYPVSTHSCELRYWMASAGIDADRDVRIVVVPPPQMVANLSAGNIDGYCAGEPWNSLAVSMGLGQILMTSRQLWGGRLEKVLGVTEHWANSHPRTLQALIRALLLAGSWVEDNRAEAAQIMARPSYLNAPVEVVKASLVGPFRHAWNAQPDEQSNFLLFHRSCANFPWRSQALWYLAQIAQSGQLPAGLDHRLIADRAYRPDLYREAALQLGFAVPTVDYKQEGGRPEPWVLDEATEPIPMAPDPFFDGRVFSPPAIPPIHPPLRPAGESAGA